MKYIAASLALFILLSCSPSIVTPSTSYPGASATSDEAAVPRNIEEEILTYINDHRRSRGLGALQMNEPASQQALNHSRNMATGKTSFGHNGFEQRIKAIKQAMGTTFIAASAENVALGQMSAREVVKGWLNSPGHKKNIEGNYNLTGIGVYRSNKGDLYFTQIFLKK